MAEAAEQQQLTLSCVAVVLAEQAPLSPASARAVDRPTSAGRRSAAWVLMAVVAIPLAVAALASGPKQSSHPADRIRAVHARATAPGAHTDRVVPRRVWPTRVPARPI